MSRPQVPMPTDAFELLQFNMIRAHSTFKLGYDNIIAILGRPPTDDISNFLGYCEAWAKAIECHHDSEEEVVFPFLNQKMDFSKEKEAHTVIHGCLNKLLAIIYGAKTEPTTFDAVELLKLMVEFRDPLYSHLDDEVEHIKPENIQASGFAEDEVKGMMDRLVAYSKSHGDPFLLLPFMRSHTPPEHKNWPEFPWVLGKIIVPYVLSWRYSRYWKYSPYALS